MNADPDDWMATMTADDAADPPTTTDAATLTGGVWTEADDLLATLAREADTRRNLFPADYPDDDEADE